MGCDPCPAESSVGRSGVHAVEARARTKPRYRNSRSVARSPQSVAHLLPLLVFLLSQAYTASGQEQILECCSGGANACVPPEQAVPCETLEDLQQARINALNYTYQEVTITVARGAQIGVDFPLFFATYNYEDPFSFPKDPVPVQITLKASQGDGPKPMIYCTAPGVIGQHALQFYWAGTVDSMVFMNCQADPASGGLGGALLFDLYYPSAEQFASYVTVSNCEFYQNSNMVYIGNPNDPLSAPNYTGVLQIVGGGVFATVDSCVFQQNVAMGYGYQGGDYGYKGAGAVTIAATLSAGGSLVIQDSVISYNGWDDPNVISHSNILVWCTNYLLPGYNSAIIGQCSTRVARTEISMNTAEISSGVQMMCGGLQCSLDVVDSDMSYNTYHSTSLAEQVLLAAPTEAYPCQMLPASVVFMSDYGFGALSISNSVFKGNNATVLGMDICGLYPGYAIIQDSLFEYNECGPCTTYVSPTGNTHPGGPLSHFLGLSSVELYRVAVANNTDRAFNMVNPDFEYLKPFISASSAFTTYDIGEIVVDGCQFEGNTGVKVGALEFTTVTGAGPVAIRNSEFKANAKQEGLGGAVTVANSDSLVIEKCNFVSNAALMDGGAGGAVLIQSVPNVSIGDSTFTDNHATSGGSVQVAYTEDLTIEKCNFTSNGARSGSGDAMGSGGAVLILDVPVVLLKGSTFTENAAGPGGGGAVSFQRESYMNDTNVGIQECVFERNSYFGTTAPDSDHLGGALLIMEQDVVSINKSTFSGNAARFGGAAYIMKNQSSQSSSSVTISDSEFIGNNATGGGSGGALSLMRYEDGSMTITQTTFLNNTAEGSTSSTGGAVYLGTARSLELNGCTFEYNKAVQGGAINAMSENDVEGAQYHFTSSNCSFKGNWIKPPGTGGAIAFSGLDTATIINSTFLANSASKVDEGVQGLGGAIVVLSLGDSLEVSGCTFEDNTAILGGAMILQNTGKAIIYKSTFHGNRGSGGAVALGVGTSTSVFLSTFEHNIAFPDTLDEVFDLDRTLLGVLGASGGAIYQAQGSRVSVQSSKFAYNTAGAGGAMFISAAAAEVDIGWFYYFCGGKAPLAYTGDFSAAWGDYYNKYANENKDACTLPASTFINNTAYAGGAIASLDSAVRFGNRMIDLPKVLDATMLIQGNVAMSGGAFSLVRNDPMSVIGARIIGNKADPALFPEPLYFKDNALSQTMHALVSSVAGCGNGTGGALCVSGTGQSVDLQLLQNDTIDGNMAQFGGGMFIESSTEQCGDPDECWTLALYPATDLETNEFVPGYEPQFTNNEAAGGGGAAVFLNNRGTINIWCSEYNASLNESLQFQDTERSAQYVPCMSWTGNMVTSGGFGGLMGSSAVSFDFVEPFATTLFPPIFDYNTSEYNSADGLAITIRLFDIYNQEFETAVDSYNLGTSVLVYTEDNNTLGQRQLTVTGQKGTDRQINGLRLQTNPGPYSLSFFGTMEGVKRDLPLVPLNVHVRDCRIGEVSAYNFTLCLFCEASFFSTNPLSSNCQECPDGAVCNIPPIDGPSGVIAPEDTAFNSNPFSAQVHGCQFDRGCTYTDGTRLDRIYEYQTTITLNPDLYNATTYYAIMCAPGHTGPLCGACLPGYGLKRDGCRECVKKMYNDIYLILTNIFALCMVTITFIATLKSYERIRSGRANHLADEIFEDASIPTSLIKVLVSYLSVITVLQDVDLNYPDDFTEFTSIANSVTDVPGTIVSLDCSLRDSGDVPRAMIETLLNVCSFAYVSILFIVFWLLQPWGEIAYKWAKAKGQTCFNKSTDVDEDDAVLPVDDKKESHTLNGAFETEASVDVKITSVDNEEDTTCYEEDANMKEPPYWWAGYRKRVMVTIIIVIFQYYQTVVDALLGIFICIDVDEQEDELNDNGSPNLAYKYGLWTDQYWEADMRQTCYTSKHAILAYAVGVPGVLVFCIIIPLGTALWLRRNFHRLGDMDFYFVYGFLYGEYRPQFFYWESIIMARKIAFSVAVNFMVNSETVTVLLVLIVIIAVSTVLHIAAQPYTRKIVSVMETVSLYVTMVSLYLAVYLTSIEVDRSQAVKNVVVWIMITINIITIIAFVFLIVMYIVKMRLTEYGVQNLETDENGKVKAESMDAFLQEEYPNKYVRKAMHMMLNAMIKADNAMSAASRNFSTKLAATRGLMSSNNMIEASATSWSDVAKSKSAPDGPVKRSGPSRMQNMQRPNEESVSSRSNVAPTPPSSSMSKLPPAPPPNI